MSIRSVLRPLGALLFASVLAVEPTAASTIWTVDQAGGADFTVLQDAVDAASNGDLILIAPGPYDSVVVQGKGLVLLGQGVVTIGPLLSGAAVEAIRVEGLAADQQVVLDGLNFFSSVPFAPSVMHVATCAGPVWIRDVFADAYGSVALHVEASASVVLVDCLMQTNASTPTPAGEPRPQPGARVELGSRLYGYDTDFRGSHGPLAIAGVPPVTSAEPGGDGVRVVDSQVQLFACGLFAGGGSSFHDGTCLVGADGGHGLVLEGAGGSPPLARLTEVQLQGGFPGFHDPGCSGPGSQGLPLLVLAGQAIETQQPARLLAIEPGAPTGGDPVQVGVEAEPGDLIFLYAAGLASAALPIADQALHLFPVPLLLVHAAAASGPYQVGLPTPGLKPGVEGLGVPLQAVVLDGLGALHLSGPQLLILLGA